ncbi:MAG: hypothetical protein KAU36_02670 [candidate division Zixibacteria bacterium]|nr:hypothetical protein [candidate division Zixibacteria bacterium]
MEEYLKLFELAVAKQIQIVGEEVALGQARKAGLGVSREGHIISCVGNPRVVLLRLIRYFTAGGNLMALAECTPLIVELTQEIGGAVEEDEALMERTGQIRI